MDSILYIFDLIVQYPFVCLIIAIAFAFDFTNGMHDSANSVATIVSTRVLSPKYAVIWAASFNFIAVFLIGTEVAKTIWKWMIDISIVTPMVIFCALIWAIWWNILTWVLGLPTSSSHALLWWYLWSAVAKAGVWAVIMSGWTKTIIFIFIAPLIWMTLWVFLLVWTTWVIHLAKRKNLLLAIWLSLLSLVAVFAYFEAHLIGWVWAIIVILTFWWLYLYGNSLNSVNKLSRYMQLLSAALYSIGHWANDAQKTMWIIVSLLLSVHAVSSSTPPLWVILWAYIAIAMWTMTWGWRIVKTMGHKIVKLRPIDWFCAETASAVSLFTAAHFGVPISTTHAIAGAITGVWLAKSSRAVHWGVAWHIFLAWIFTIPWACAVGYVLYKILGTYVMA